MNKNLLSSLLVVIGVFILPIKGIAEDIDLFATRPVANSDNPPNVLFVLDNGANFSSNVTTLRCAIDDNGNVSTGATLPTGYAWTYLDKTAAAVEQCAIYAAIKALDASGTAFNIGFMGFNATKLKQFDPTVGEWNASGARTDSCINSSGGKGGCLLMKMVPFNTTTKPRILNWIRNWDKNASPGALVSANNSANGATMQEAWAYFNGAEGISTRRYAGLAPNTAICSGGNNIIFVGNAYDTSNNGGDQTATHSSPRLRLIGDGSAPSSQRAAPAANTQETSEITRTLNVCGSTTTITSFNEDKGGSSLNWALYMRNHGIKTYSIGVLGPRCKAEYAAQLATLGNETVGGGKYFGTNSFDELKISIGAALSEIISRNAAFASVSLPVSVNTQGTYINQVYIGMFRPAQDFFPRWPGNLKQYRMAMVGDALKLVDRQTPDTSAISSSGGFIAECAQSYWSPTPSASDDYWKTTFSSANCSPWPAGSDSPDGNVVEKGAAAYKLRQSAPRSLMKTCSSASPGCSLINFETSPPSGITPAQFGVASSTDRDTLIAWALGANNKGDEAFVSTTATRPSIHGDVVHSRPVAINFATGTSPDVLGNRKVVVFYGGNDGVLRAINGNRDRGLSIGGKSPGREIWSFIAPESFPIIKRLRDNSIPIYFPGTTATGALPKSYGFDGPLTAFTFSTNKYLAASMRRGGRKIYGFNVTATGSGSAPTSAWSLGCSVNLPIPDGIADEQCAPLVSPDTEGFSKIGQTWSTPKLLNIPAYTTAPVLIFGGGYDPCEDNDNGTANHSCVSSSKGNRIYLINGTNGALLKRFNTERGVVGDITIVPDSTGRSLYAYASDLGGNIYRITLPNSNPSTWTDSNIVKIASLGCNTTGSCDANRKFMFGPDIVDENGTYYLMIGSGDREKPVRSYVASRSVNNAFFVVKDKPSDTTWLTTENANCGSGVICKNSLTEIDSGNPISAKGWYLNLDATEQVVTSAITIYGSVTFSTHIPYVAPDVITSPSQCQSLGTSRVYNISYIDAAATGDSRYADIAGGGLPPSPVAGKVTLDDGTTVPFVIGASPSSPLESKKPDSPASSGSSQPKVRVYWHIQK